MSETANTEEIARLLSESIFSKFGWQQCGPYNQNFECVELELHRKKKAKSHPGDVVFRVPDPYLGLDVYLHTDLKSYGKDSIEKADLKSILRSLAITVDCANKSPGWTKLYDQTEGNHVVHGLLFIYNHDQQYDKDFLSVLQQIGDGIPQLPDGKRIYVIGPERALYLFNVASDILYLQGKKQLPDDTHIRFFHPDLENTKILTNQLGPATVESLLSPWQVLYHNDSAKGAPAPGYVIYYSGSGADVDEFLYLLDFIFTYQILGDDANIQIRLPNADKHAVNTFEKAKVRYGEEFWSVEAHSKEHFQNRLKRLTCISCPTRIPYFSIPEIGLKHG